MGRLGDAYGRRLLRAVRDRLAGLQVRLTQSEQLYLVLASAVIGIGGGLCAVAFRMAIRVCNRLAWHDPFYTSQTIRQLPAWWIVLVPAVGGLIVGWIVHAFAREAKGHGVPEVIEAVAVRGGRIRPRVVLAKLLASAICIGSGGSVGREGPIVQIGSAFGSTLGQWMGLDPRRLRTLVACGAAAGIAATFNAPVAGALFAAEIILGEFGIAGFSPIVIASVAATAVGHAFLGDVRAFEVPGYELVHVAEFGHYVVLGLLAGLAAVAFIRCLYGMEDLFERSRLPGPLRTMLGGALIGLLALLFPQILGVGYEAIGEALRSQIVWPAMLALVLIKILAVSVTIGSGGSGGIFAPSLFIGAMLGGALGTVVHSLWPMATAGPGAYALVGMGAVVAAATHAPITAIVIIFELTGDYQIMLPLMTSSILATLVSSRLERASIYTLKLLRRGVDIQQGRDVRLLQQIRVRDVMRTNPITVTPETNLARVVRRLIENPVNTIFVVDGQRRLLGIIQAERSRSVLANARALEPLVIARDIMQEGDFPIARPDDNLAELLRVLSRYRGEVPVVENGRLIGHIWPEDVLERYNTEVLKRDLATRMASAVQKPRSEPLPIGGNVEIAEIPVPPPFVGHSLAELDVRKRYGVSILLVRRRVEQGQDELLTAPSPGYTFGPQDVLVVMGDSDALRSLRRGRPRA